MEDVERLKKLLPSSGGCCVIVSSQRDWPWPGFDVIDVGESIQGEEEFAELLGRYPERVTLFVRC